MQTTIATALKQDPRAQAAESVLQKCVHCGFCLATCPTYNLLGDELDSPRGRIYLIKQVVEGSTPTRSTLTHLDRCLTCRNCETTCPSGVQYGHLLDAGRSLVEEQVSRSMRERWMRKGILSVLPYANRVGPLVRLGQLLRPVMPGALARSIPRKQTPGAMPQAVQRREMIVLDGCVQPSMTPGTNASAVRVLNALGVSLRSVSGAGCCGAVHFHLNEQDGAKQMMRRNIDAWWPKLETGSETIVTTASGCGVMVKDYGHVLADDPDYADKARAISERCSDIAEVITDLFESVDLSRYQASARQLGPVAFHPPCTLQHGQKLPLITERLLQRLGFELTRVPDSHTCCGSAGTYSIFQPEISAQLKKKKLENLQSGKPRIIATANIGCQIHLQSGLEEQQAQPSRVNGRINESSADKRSAADEPIRHWIELLDQLICN